MGRVPEWKICCELKTWEDCADNSGEERPAEVCTGQALPNFAGQGVPTCRVCFAPETSHPTSSVPDASAPTHAPAAADRTIR